MSPIFYGINRFDGLFFVSGKDLFLSPLSLLGPYLEWSRWINASFSPLLFFYWIIFTNIYIYKKQLRCYQTRLPLVFSYCNPWCTVTRYTFKIVLNLFLLFYCRIMLEFFGGKYYIYCIIWSLQPKIQTNWRPYIYIKFMINAKQCQ